MHPQPQPSLSLDNQQVGSGCPLLSVIMWLLQS